MGPPEYEIADFKDPSPDLPFVVSAESLLVASGVDDGHLIGLLEQVDYVLLSLHGSVMVQSLHSWGTVVEVGVQHCFSSIGQEEGCEPCGSVRGRSQAPEDHLDLCNPSPGVLVESVIDVWLKSLDDHAINMLDLTVSTWVFDRGLVDSDAISITEVQELLPSEVSSVVNDDIVRNAKPVDDVEEELDRLFRADVGDGFGLYPLGEFVDCDE